MACLCDELCRDREPLPHADSFVFCEAIEDGPNVIFLEMPLSEVPVHRCENFESCNMTGGEAIRVARELAHLFGARLVQVTLRDVCRVEVDHERSRSSET